MAASWQLGVNGWINGMALNTSTLRITPEVLSLIATAFGGPISGSFAKLRKMTDKVGAFAARVDRVKIIVPARLRDAGHKRVKRRIVGAAPYREEGLRRGMEFGLIDLSKGNRLLVYKTR